MAPLAEQARKLYTRDADPVYGPPANQWIADTEFRCSAVTQLIWHTVAGNPSYQYEFARSLPGLIAGAYHSMDLYYVFGTLEGGILGSRECPGLRATNAVDRQVSDAMQLYWTNFVKTGDPNGGGLPAWPKFDPTSRAYIQFADAGPIAKEGLRRPQCDLFIENVKRLTAK